MDAGNGLVQPTNRSVTPLILDFMDPTMAYYPNVYASAYYNGGKLVAIVYVSSSIYP